MLGLLLISLAGCSSAGTELTRSRDPSYVNIAFRHVAVFADARDLRQRQLIEEAVVAELRRVDIGARPSIEVLPATRDYTPEERARALIAAGADGILIVSGESGVESVYVPVRATETTKTAQIQVQGNQAQYRETARTTQDGGYTVQKPWSRVTTRLVDLYNGQTAWLAFTETHGNGFSDFGDIRKSYARALSKQVRDDRIIATEHELENEARTAPPAPTPPAPSTSPAAATVAPAAPASPAVAAVAPATSAAPAVAAPPPVAAPPQPLSERLEGCVVASQDGQFLGKISADAARADSLLNATGPNGSRTSKVSIFNPASPYGGAQSALSAFNPSADTPPSIFCNDHFEAYLTVNPAKTPAVDPRLLSATLRSSSRK